MWFTTRAGLCRYDGYDVKVYQYDPADTSSLSDLYVKSTIVEDTFGFIWVGSLNGLNRFDPNMESFKRYYYNPEDPQSISSSSIRRIYIDRQGTLWVGTNGRGLNRYDHLTDNFFRYFPSHDHSIRTNTVNGMYEDGSGNFWVGTTDGLYLFDRGTGKFKLVKYLTKPGERINNRFTTLTEDREGNIWYCADRIYVYDTMKKTLTHFTGFPDSLIGNPNPKYMDILLDTLNNKQILWIARSNLYKIDLQTGKMSVIKNDPADHESYIGSNPRAFYRDPSGLTWLATIHGITIMDQGIETISAHPEFASNHGVDAQSFYKDSRGHLWIGIRDKGLLHLDADMKVIHQYIPNREEGGDNPFSGPVRKILEDHNHNIWILCQNDGVYLLNRETKIFNRCSMLKNGKDFIPTNLYDIYEDSQGTIWICGPGLYYRHKDPGGPVLFQRDTTHYLLKYATLTHIEEDHDSNLWIGSNTGSLICRLKGDNGYDSIVQYTHDPENPKSLSNNYIWSVYVDDTGSVWIGTNHGLNRFKKDQDNFDRYMTDVQSGASFIYDITSDKSGYLWLGTEMGLVRYDPSMEAKGIHAENRIREFIPFSKTFPYVFYKDEEGKIYIGSASSTGNGYFSLHPDSIKENKIIPPVVLTEFRIRNELAEPDSSITTKKHLILNHNENFFSFEFATLDYNNPAQNQYAYKLEGLDEDWIYSGDRRFANYTGVPPGEYTFRVKGSNSDGYWNETGISLRITLLTPPWKTWWAYLLYCLLIIVVLIIAIRFYLRRQRLIHKLELEHIQTVKLEELDKMKSRFFANISHEFRTPLTLIIGPLRKHLSGIQDTELNKDLNIIQRNALRLQRLINQLLTLSKLESDKLKLDAGLWDAIPLIRGYVQSFESLARQKDIELVFNADIDHITLYADREKLETILNNLLSNAFKFTGEGGRIEVAVRSSQFTVLSPQSSVGNETTEDRKLKTEDSLATWIEVKISDTGSGISPDRLPHIFDRFYQADESYTGDQEGSGIGLALTKELVELHHGKITVESKVGVGTSFTVLLPLGDEHLNREEKVGSSQLAVDIPPLSPHQGEESVGAHTPSNIDNNLESGTRNLEQNSKPILLVVEDNTDLRAYIRSYLEPSYNVLEATNGKEGLQHAMEQIPDLVVSDVMMPEMDGFELCKKLKTEPLTSHIPVILLTARASSESKIEGLETGADDYISKPFDHDEFLVRIKNLILQRQKLREIFSSDLKEQKQDTLFPVPTTGIGLMDKQFLEKSIEIVEDQMSNTEFNAESFSKEMAVSRMQLHRKLKALTNLTATEFIRTIRLNKASILIRSKSGTFSEIAYDVGFNTLSYFTKCFREKFGTTPSEYQETHTP